MFERFTDRARRVTVLASRADSAGALVRRPGCASVAERAAPDSPDRCVNRYGSSPRHRIQIGGSVRVAWSIPPPGRADDRCRVRRGRIPPNGQGPQRTTGSASMPAGVRRDLRRDFRHWNDDGPVHRLKP